MTIATQSALAGPFTGNGSTTVFAFSFKCFAQADLQVIREESNVQTVLTITTDYTVTLNADQEASPGGNVTMVTAPTATQTVFIVSDVDYTQEAAFTNAGGFYPTVLNDARDRTTLQIQQLNDKIARAPLVPIGETASADLLTDIDALGDVAGDIATVAGISDEVEAVADIDAEVVAVANIAPDVVTVANQLGFTPDILVGAGQSNMASSNEQAAGGTLEPDQSVFLWQGSAWEVWTPADGYEFYPGGTTITRNNVLFQAAKLRRRLTGRRQYCILDAFGGRPIEDWVPATEQRWVSMEAQIVAALASTEMTTISKTTIDGFFWFQGEANSASGDYAEKMDTLVTQLEAESWWRKDLFVTAAEINDNFVQNRYWRSAAVNANPKITVATTKDLTFGGDGIHLTGDEIDVAGSRMGYLSLSGAGFTPPDPYIARPLSGSSALTFAVGSGYTFETAEEALLWLNDKTTEGLAIVTIQLQPGTYGPIDTSVYTNTIPVEIRSLSTGPGTLPAASALASGSAAAITTIEGDWDVLVECTAGDAFAVNVTGDYVTFRGIAFMDNGAGVDRGIDVTGTTSFLNCAVHGFAVDQMIVRQGGKADISNMVFYGGGIGLNVFGECFDTDADTAGRKIVCAGQSTHCVVANNGGKIQRLSPVDFGSHTGDQALSCRNGSFASFVSVSSAANVNGIALCNERSEMQIDSVTIPGVNSVGTVDTFTARKRSHIYIDGGIDFNTTGGRAFYCPNGGQIYVVGNVVIDDWTGSGANNLILVNDPDSKLCIDGTLTITAAASAGTNNIRTLTSGQIITTGITNTAGVGTNPTSLNSLQTDLRIIVG